MVGRRSGILKNILKQYAPASRARGRAVKRFARKIGLVYFGSVDQHDDEHEVVRGLTASTTHRDQHYAVGAYDGYDVSLVDRFDVHIDPQGHASEHSWLIMQVNLERTAPLPHIFLRPTGHHATVFGRFFNATRVLHPVNSLLLGQHSLEFHNRYELFASSDRVPEIEEVLTETTSQTIAATLWPQGIELFENKLYVYVTEEALSESLLDAIVQSALWLARTIDGEPQN